jgi:hypothetical protein
LRGAFFRTASSHTRTSAGTGSAGPTFVQRQAPPDQRHPARRTHAALARLEARLRCVSDQSEVLYHGRCAQDPARPPRGRPRCRTAEDEDQRIRRSRDERKRVEMRFAHLKTHHGFERMRLRGLFGARDEFHLAAIVQNLKTMALRILGPPPQQARALVVWASVLVSMPTPPPTTRRRPSKVHLSLSPPGPHRAVL